MAILEGRGIKKHFGGLLAVDGVNFHVDQGEIVCLIGPNGAGKTTLFNVICGFYAPDDGIIEFNGKKISGFRPYQICRKGVARTFQVTRSFHQMSVLENIMVGALFGHRSHKRLKDAREEAMQLLEFTGFLAKADMLVTSLTSIDARRLELVSALAAKPTLLLLDEVMAGLNLSEVAEAMELVKKLRSEMGITILMVEHIMKSVMGISDRIIVLANGLLIAEGTPKEISEDPVVIEAYLGGSNEL